MDLTLTPGVIKISCATGSGLKKKLPVSALVNKGLAIHHGCVPFARYTVTHIATGRAIRHFRLKKQALSFMVFCLSYGDWTERSRREAFNKYRPALAAWDLKAKF